MKTDGLSNPFTEPVSCLMWSGNVNKSHNNLEDIITGRDLNYLAFKIPGYQQRDQLHSFCQGRCSCLVLLAVEENTGQDGAPMQSVMFEVSQERARGGGSLLR